MIFTHLLVNLFPFFAKQIHDICFLCKEKLQNIRFFERFWRQKQKIDAITVHSYKKTDIYHLLNTFCVLQW